MTVTVPMRLCKASTAPPVAVHCLSVVTHVLYPWDTVFMHEMSRYSSRALPFIFQHLTSARLIRCRPLCSGARPNCSSTSRTA